MLGEKFKLYLSVAQRFKWEFLERRVLSGMIYWLQVRESGWRRGEEEEEVKEMEWHGRVISEKRRMKGV